MLLQYLQVSRSALPVLDCMEGFDHPRQSFPAWGTPSAGLLCKKLLYIMHRAYRTGTIIDNNYCACSQAAAGFLHRVEIHFHIEMLFSQKFRRGPARYNTAQSVTFRHAACMLLNNFSHCCSYRKLPQALILYPAADTVYLCTAVLAASQT